MQNHLTYKYFKTIFVFMALSMSFTASASNVDRKNSQISSHHENKLKAFAYNWYAEFDRGASMEEIAPNIVESGITYALPQRTLTSIEQLKMALDSSKVLNKATGHELGDVFIHPTVTPNVYDVITPHTYFVDRNDGSSAEVVFASRMKVHLGKKTMLDPSGKLPKLETYVARLVKASAGNNVAQTISSRRQGNFNHNHIKSFVHTWFAHADTSNSKASLKMVSEKSLNFNLFGSHIRDKKSFKRYLKTLKESQAWATHTPHSIYVQQSDKGFKVTFFVHFEGDAEGVGMTKQTNLTQWQLVEEKGELKLRDYSVEVF